MDDIAALIGCNAGKTQPGYCAAVKRDNRPCRGRAGSGSDYCGAHRCQRCPARNTGHGVSLGGGAWVSGYCEEHLPEAVGERREQDEERARHRAWCDEVRPAPDSLEELQARIRRLHHEVDYDRPFCGTCGPGWPCQTYAAAFGGQVYQS